MWIRVLYKFVPHTVIIQLWVGTKRKNALEAYKLFLSFFHVLKCFSLPENIIIVIIIATNDFFSLCYRNVSRQILIFIPSYQYLYIPQSIIKAFVVLSTQHSFVPWNLGEWCAMWVKSCNHSLLSPRLGPFHYCLLMPKMQSLRCGIVRKPEASMATCKNTD